MGLAKSTIHGKEKKKEIAEIISPLHNGCSGTAGLIIGA